MPRSTQWWRSYSWNHLGHVVYQSSSIFERLKGKCWFWSSQRMSLEYFRTPAWRYLSLEPMSYFVNHLSHLVTSCRMISRWPYFEHPLAHLRSDDCHRPAAESSIGHWSCFPASCWRCFAWEKCSRSVGLVDWWSHWDCHQILKEKCLFRCLSSCCLRFELIIKQNWYSWRHLIFGSCLNELFHGLLHCWKQNLRFACHYGKLLAIFERSEKLKLTRSYLFSVFLDWNFGLLEIFETKCCGSTLKIAKRILQCFSFATLSVA